MLHCVESVILRFVKFYEGFGFSPSLSFFTSAEKVFRIKALQEELNEYRDAETEEQEFDALIDLFIFLIGTVYRHGWLSIFVEGCHRVLAANEKKEIGSLFKRGDFKLDLIKPEGWEPPILSDLLDPFKARTMPNDEPLQASVDIGNGKDTTEFTDKIIEKGNYGIKHPIGVVTVIDRQERYGKFEDSARVTRQLFTVVENSPGYDKLSDVHKDAYYMIFQKIARSCSGGDPNYIDNPRDIAGYATRLEEYLCSLKPDTKS